jgi:hypothetical protein
MPNVPSSPTAAEDVVERKTNSEIPNNDGSRQEQRLLGAAPLLGHMVEYGKGILHMDESDAFAFRFLVNDLTENEIINHLQGLLETARQWYPNQHVVGEICFGPRLANTSPPVDEKHQS